MESSELSRLTMSRIRSDHRRVCRTCDRMQDDAMLLLAASTTRAPTTEEYARGFSTST